jgi:hypothetical protein
VIWHCITANSTREMHRATRLLCRIQNTKAVRFGCGSNVQSHRSTAIGLRWNSTPPPTLPKEAPEATSPAGASTAAAGDSSGGWRGVRRSLGAGCFIILYNQDILCAAGFLGNVGTADRHRGRSRGLLQCQTGTKESRRFALFG